MATRANPLNGQVAGGQATIQNNAATRTLTITQGSQSAVINWTTFNIGLGETTQFVQPNASAIALNRVTGGLGPSEILGHLQANGRVYLVNPSGFLFGSGASINVSGFLATTHDITNANFMAGNYKFTIPGRPDASIVNLGTITAANGGFAALVAPGVRNAGVITANLGNVALASGNGFTLDFYGDQLITLQVGDRIASKVIDVATGQPLKSLVKNEGVLRANGGQVSLTAAAARRVVDSVINNRGVIEANSIGTRHGMIVLGAATAATKHTRVKQTVKVSGTLSASGQNAGEKGGVIQISGENVILSHAKLDASGQAGGGTVLIGGDLGGGTVNPTVNGLPQAQLQSWPVPTATSVSIDAATMIDASAKLAGDGGKVVVWSNGPTSVAGSIYATGGPSGGNGGFVETSGHTLNIGGATVTTAAPKGQPGHWLLDPADFTIDLAAATSINTSLAQGSDVLVATSASGTGGEGDIFVNTAISWSTDAGLTLDANHGIFVNANITANSNHARLTFLYNDGGTGGNLLTAPGKSVTLVGSSPVLTINGHGYTLIHNPNQLQALGTSGYFALANDINLSPISNFVPLGFFTGTFDGLGHTVSNLNVSTGTMIPSSAFIGFGLFSGIGDGATVQNLGLDRGTITAFATPPPQTLNVVGALAGQVGFARIVNVHSNLAVTGGPSNGTGGLVGMNAGSINMSYATGDVSSSSNAVGGLVGFNFEDGNINQSFATGNVSGAGFVGGLVGITQGLFSGTKNSITNSFATGSVSGGAELGGLVGEWSILSSISNSYSTGSVFAGSNATAIGGFIGSINGAVGIIQNSFSTGSVSTGPQPGRIGAFIGDPNTLTTPIVNSGAILNGASINTVIAPWDFAHTWYIGPNGLPLLQAFRPIPSAPPVTPPPSTPNSPNIFTISYNPSLLNPFIPQNLGGPLPPSTGPILNISPTQITNLPPTALPQGGPSPIDNNQLNELVGGYVLAEDELFAEKLFKTRGTLPFKVGNPVLTIAGNWEPLIQGNKRVGFATAAQIITDAGIDILADIVVASLCAASGICVIAVAVVSVAAAWYVDTQLQQ